MLQFSPRSQEWFEVKVLEGRAAILAHEPLLADFAQHCEQAGAMGWLEYFFATKNGCKKGYCVALLLKSGKEHEFGVDDIYGVGLYKEYRPLGVRIGVYASDDYSGMRTVIAPRSRRSEAGAVLAEAMLRRGAQVVLTCLPASALERRQTGTLLSVPRVLYAERQRTVRKQMWLGTTFEETLMRLGKSTRFNLRYYRKRLAAKVGCEFVADARAELREEELKDLNRGSLNPDDLDEVRLRYRASCGLPDGFLVGLRDGEGRWLSLIGGWRQGDTTCLHWQLNVGGYEKYSLCTAMRSYFLEHETLRGTRRLVIYGGTGHSMSHSFDVESVCQLVARRRSARAWLLVNLIKAARRLGRLTGATNILADVLCDRELDWREVPGEGFDEHGDKDARRDKLETA